MITECGQRMPYDKLVLCLGSWTNDVLQASGLSLLPNVASLEQFVYYDFKDKSPSDLLILIECNIDDGVPGIKVGMHCNGELMVSPEFLLGEKAAVGCLANHRIEPSNWMDGIRTDIDSYMEGFTRRFVQDHIPSVDATKVSSYDRCIYQACCLSDGRFLTGQHPEDPDILVACAFTSEDLKFAPVIGEFLISLATNKMFTFLQI